MCRLKYRKKTAQTGKIVSPINEATLDENSNITLEHDSNTEHIDVLASHDGYDEDGNGVFNEWRATRFRTFRGKATDLQYQVGTIDASAAESELTWNTHWIPNQHPQSIKLIARVHSNDNLIYMTETVENLSLEAKVFPLNST